MRSQLKISYNLSMANENPQELNTPKPQKNETNTSKVNQNNIAVKIKTTIEARENLETLADPDLKDEDEQQNTSKDSIKLPVPDENNNKINQEKAQKWIEEDVDPRFKALKQKIIDSINHVTHKEFSDALQEVVDKLEALLVDQEYAVLFDYKPHSSRRWVYELAKGMLKRKPKTATYEPGKQSQELHDRLMDYLYQDQKIDQFVVFDDAIYSGEQVINNTIIQIIRYFSSHPPQPGRRPRIILAVPYMTNRFLQAMQVNAQRGNIVLLNVRPLPTLMEQLSEEEWALIDEREGTLDLEWDSDEVISAGETLTFFDHRVPDNFSYTRSCSKITDKGEIPYKAKKTPYYEQEEIDFKIYKEKYPNQ